METAALKSFASVARTLLLREVSARLNVVLSGGSAARVEAPGAVAALERAVSEAGGGEVGRTAVVDRVAYTWFNRVVALRFMDANGFTSVGVVSPAQGRTSGQPAVLADAKASHIDADVVPAATAKRVAALLGDQLTSADPQGEAYGLLLLAYCRYWNTSMPFMFEADADYTELLMPSDLLAEDSVMARAVTAMSPDVCQDVEVIGWLYQFYIADRKDEVFAGFKKNKKAGPAEIPAATQLFTPHWIVRYLVENSLGRLWLLNHPKSGLQEQMEYYIAPVDEKTEFLKVASPEELKVIDPACGSGHMLTYAFDLLYAIYEEEGYAPAEIPGLILRNNLYGTEIDPRAGNLAAFALTMKARQRQRTFFAKTVQPNICVLEPIRFTVDELDGLVTPGGNRADEEAFLNQFADADTFGSLIRPNESLIDPLQTHLRLKPAADLLSRAAHVRAQRVVHQSEYLSQRYHVVVANPPYMGNGNMGDKLGSWAKREFDSSKADLFAMFIVRSWDLAIRGGYTALITMHSWMFLTSYQKLRISMLGERSIITMAHLGSGAFDSISGAIVATTAFVVKNSRVRGMRGTYLNLLDGKSEAAKESAMKSALSNVEEQFLVSDEDLLLIPGSQIAYGLPEHLLQLVTAGRSLGDIVAIRAGISTGDNSRFIRYWFEVESQRTAVGARVDAPWKPHNKGGPFRRWYGNIDHVLRYTPTSIAEMRTLPGFRHDGADQYFAAHVSWSEVTTGRPGFRFYPAGMTFGSGSKAIVDEHRLYSLLAYLNSSTVSALLAVLSPGIKTEVGHIAGLPGVDLSAADKELSGLARQAVELAKTDWDTSERSLDFLRLPLLANHRLISIAIREMDRVAHARQAEIAQLEERIDAVVAATMLEAESQPRKALAVVSSEPGEPDPSSRVIDLLSYAVGCIFGRYSLDLDGLVLASLGETLDDFLARVVLPTFTPDADNVVPITDGEWFEDDIVSRFRQFLRVSFGEEHFEENLRFVEESLGKDIRSYFLKDFYKDHVQRYKKRPIYWLFSSPKGSFNALIYLHRYTPSTVSTVLNEYLREFQTKLTGELVSQERDSIAAADPKARNAAAKESDRLRKVLVELNDYEHDVLYPLASRQISIDLDDGVKANYLKFGAALKKIAGLESASE